SDTATLEGLVNPTGEGEVTFTLYKGPECEEEVASLGSPDNPVEARSEERRVGKESTEAGAHHWLTNNTGDANNDPANGVCEEEGENTNVEQATAKISTVADASVTVGAKIKDVATLTGLVNPTGKGEVTFTLYKGPECEEEVASLGSPDNPVEAEGEYTSEEFETTEAGAYH